MWGSYATSQQIFYSTVKIFAQDICCVKPNADFQIPRACQMSTWISEYLCIIVCRDYKGNAKFRLGFNFNLGLS